MAEKGLAQGTAQAVPGKSLRVEDVDVYERSFVVVAVVSQFLYMFVFSQEETMRSVNKKDFKTS